MYNLSDEEYETYIKRMYKPEKNLTLLYVVLAFSCIFLFSLAYKDLQATDYNSEAAEHLEKIKSQPVKLVKHKMKRKIKY